MCGIAGYLGTGDRELLERMAAYIRHRGPDDGGLWISDTARIGFAHRRLAILDLSPRGHQPMQDEGEAAVVCYNGEIYNFAELRSDLEGKGWKFRSTSDTEVLLKGYLEYGHGVVDRLNGIFAFAIHDRRSGETFLARDPFGVKPLYLAQLQGTLLFASELKSILADPRVARTLDPKALIRYLTFLWSPGTATPLAGVRRLAPGSAVVVRDGTIVREWEYFELKFGGGGNLTPQECVDGVAMRLREAVRRQMVADVQVGAFLSGGVDSSAIVAMAREFTGGQSLECFTIAPHGTAMAAEGVTDDLPFARYVALELGVRLHTIPVEAGMVSNLGKVIYHLDEPQADPAAVNVMLIAELARSNGIKVLLSGSGGDDVFSGYRRHIALQAEGLWSWLPQSLRAATAGAANRLHVANPLLRKVRKALQNAGSSPDCRLFGYFHWTENPVAAALLDMPVDPGAADEPFIETLRSAGGSVQGLDRMLLLEQRHFLADHNLLYTDKLTMAHGVEGRVPFLDPNLVTFVNSLPPNIKQRRGVGKWLLKQVLSRYLPRDIVHRPKTGFGAPLRQWVRSDLVPVIDEVLSPRGLTRRGVFQATNARNLIESDRAGHVDASYTVYAMLCMELWFRTFLDPAHPAEISHLPGL